MLPTPCLGLLHVLFAAEVARVLAAPLLPAGPLAGRPAFRPRTELLVVGIARMGLEPSPTVTTLSKPACAHRILLVKHPEAYDTHPLDGTYRRSAANTPPIPPKKEEDDLFRSRERKKKRLF
jgi:hypothetical protein